MNANEPTHPETMVEQYDWIRTIKTLPTDPHPEDYCVQTNAGVIEMDRHVHTLENHGYRVERIASDEPYGQRIYCAIH